MAYSFAPLTPAQTEARRKQLDAAGFYGWLSPIIILAAIYLYRQLLQPLLSQSTASRKSLRTPSPLRLFFRRASWIVGTTFIPEFGPLHVQITGVCYTLWLLYLVFHNTGTDYMHLTKAFGHVAVSQLPAQYLLSLKAARSPVTFATGLTHEKLNAYHRLLGRIVHGFLAAHAVLYVRFFVQLDLLGKRVKDRDVRLGLLAFWAFNFLGLLALPPIRRRVYHQVFYRSHVLLSAVVVPLLFFHVPYTRKYLLQAGVFWILGGITRANASNKANVRCEQIQGTDLIQVTLAIDRTSSFTATVPGQHVYIQSKGFGPKNPFTVLSVTPSVDAKTAQELTLVVRNLGGPQTGFLGQLAVSTGDRGDQQVSTEGPYGESSQYLPRLLSSPRDAHHQILLVAGGVGATYTLPIYLALLDARGGTPGMKFIWFTRTVDDASWGMSLLAKVRGDVDVELYITRGGVAATGSREKRGVKLHEAGGGSRRNLAAVVNAALSPPSSAGSPSRSAVISSSKRSDDPRRPRRCHDRLTVLLCGPPGLARDVRTEVGRHVLEYGRDVEWLEEQFGFGGS